MALFEWQKKVKADGVGEEFTLPDELQKQIKAGADAAAALPRITEMLEGLTKIQQDAETARKKEKDDAAAASLRKQTEEVSGTLDEQIEALALGGKTGDAIRLANQPLLTELLLLRFNQAKNEVFADEKEFEYYHGDIKKEVDKIIEGQSLSFKSDPKFARENIKNCYDTVVGRHHKEIMDGKIKTRFAGADSGSRGTSSGAAGSGANDEAEDRRRGLASDPNVVRAAKLLGFKPDEYAKMLDEEGVGYA